MCLPLPFQLPPSVPGAKVEGDYVRAAMIQPQIVSPCPWLTALRASTVTDIKEDMFGMAM